MTNNPHDAAARLRATIAAARHDRPHQALHDTLIVGARATDIETILNALQPPTATFNVDEGSPTTTQTG